MRREATAQARPARSNQMWRCGWRIAVGLPGARPSCTSPIRRDQHPASGRQLLRRRRLPRRRLRIAAARCRHAPTRCRVILERRGENRLPGFRSGARAVRQQRPLTPARAPREQSRELLLLRLFQLATICCGLEMITHGWRSRAPRIPAGRRGPVRSAEAEQGLKRRHRLAPAIVTKRRTRRGRREVGDG